MKQTFPIGRQAFRLCRSFAVWIAGVCVPGAGQHVWGGIGVSIDMDGLGGPPRNVRWARFSRRKSANVFALRKKMIKS